MRSAVHIAGTLVALLAAAPAFPQIATGSLYATVTDESGAVLADARVSLVGAFGARATVTGADGTFRYLGLDHGTYELSVSLDGFGTVELAHVVEAGASAELSIVLPLAGLEETLVVSAATPVVDPRRMGTLTTLSRDELDRVPQARDPWDLIKSAPGVIINRVNIAGAENNQQAGFTAKGSSGADTTYSIDGQQVDDYAGGGASPSYYDYGAFDEIAFTTGGNPLNVQTGGLGFNFVTKRGTNRWRGELRGLFTHDDLEWGNVPGSELEEDPRLARPDGSVADKADHIQQIHEYGFDVGGPLIHDRLFVWGSYGRQDIRKVKKDQTDQQAVLDGFNAKLSWAADNETQVSLFYSNTRKTVDGRTPLNGDFSFDDSSLVDQGPRYSGFMPLGIHGLVKLSVNRVVSSDLIVDVKYLNWDRGFGIERRDEAVNPVIDFFAGEVRGTGYFELETVRPLKNVTDVTGTYFAQGSGGSHELKFGFGYRRQDTSSTTTYGGTEEQLVGLSFGPGGSLAWVNRTGEIAHGAEYWHAFVGDTFTRERLTLTAGARFDHQTAENRAGSIPASPSFPELLPTVEFGGGGTGLSWTTLSPRVGLTYAVDADRRSVARLSFSSYAGKLNAGRVTFDNPVRTAFQAYLWDDLNQDGLVSADEVDLGSGLLYWGGHDPAAPTALETPNRIDPAYSAPRDYEIVIGFDHELLPDLALGAAYTWRRMTNVRNWRPRLRADGGVFGASDYLENEATAAEGYSGVTYSPDPSLLGGGGRLLTNRPDYYQRFDGLELTVRKRLSRGWSARVSVSYMDHREYLTGPGSVGNPSRTIDSVGASSGPQIDGGQVGISINVEGKGNRVVNARWQLNANALCELPGGFDAGATLFGRQGFAYPVQVTGGAGADGALDVLAVPTLDGERLPSFWNLDLRVSKTFRLGEARSLNVAVELFNAFDSNTVLARNPFATTLAFGRAEEIPQPRIARLSARFGF